VSLFAHQDQAHRVPPELRRPLTKWAGRRNSPTALKMQRGFECMFPNTNFNWYPAPTVGVK
jgi:hypothetical protein